MRKTLTLFAVLFISLILFAGTATSTFVNPEDSKDMLSSDSPQTNTSSTTTNQLPIPSTNQTEGLNELLLQFSEYKSGGNATLLAEIRAQMLEQEKLNSNIDHANPPTSAVRSRETLDTVYNIGYISGPPIAGHSEPTVHNGQTIGLIQNWNNIAGAQDYATAYLEVTDWYSWEDPPGSWHYIGGEALANGYATEEYTGLATFHVNARAGPQSGENWHNYVFIQVSNVLSFNEEDWLYVGYVEVHSSSLQDYTIGNINTHFKYIAVVSWCPYNWPVEKSNLYVDNVYYEEQYRRVSLTLSSSGGGTTDPTGTLTMWQYEYQPRVEAIPNPDYSLDYWLLDDTPIWRDNPIWIYMDTDHTLRAVFAYTPIPTYPTTCTNYVTWDGYNYGYYSTSTIYKPAGSNYLTFGSYFVAAYNYNDDSWHYSDPDWYNLGTGTSIDVYYDLSG